MCKNKKKKKIQRIARIIIFKRNKSYFCLSFIFHINMILHKYSHYNNYITDIPITVYIINIYGYSFEEEIPVIEINTKTEKNMVDLVYLLNYKE